MPSSHTQPIGQPPPQASLEQPPLPSEQVVVGQVQPPMPSSCSGDWQTQVPPSLTFGETQPGSVGWQRAGEAPGCGSKPLSQASRQTS